MNDLIEQHLRVLEWHCHEWTVANEDLLDCSSARGLRDLLLRRRRQRDKINELIAAGPKAG